MDLTKCAGSLWPEDQVTKERLILLLGYHLEMRQKVERDYPAIYREYAALVEQRDSMFCPKIYQLCSLICQRFTDDGRHGEYLEFVRDLEGAIRDGRVPEVPLHKDYIRTGK
jgi:hypothetical protein